MAAATEVNGGVVGPAVLLMVVLAVVCAGADEDVGAWVLEVIGTDEETDIEVVGAVDIVVGGDVGVVVGVCDVAGGLVA